MSDVVAHRMFTARQLRGKTQAWVAERLTRYTRSTWSVSAVSAAEGGTAGGRPRLFNANEVVALARTFDLTIPYFFVPPKEPELPPDFPGAPGADWDYLLFRLFGDDALQKLVSRELGPTSLPTHLSMPAGEEFSDGSVHDVATGGDGNDAINAGAGLDLLFGGAGNDLILHNQDPTQSFAGDGSDFLRGGTAGDVMTGNEGDDWLEGNNGADLVQGDNALTFQNDPNGGADIFIGGSGNDDHDAEGGDDIMTNNGVDRHAGMLGFDWVTHKYDPLVANADLGITVFQPPNVQINRSRFLNVEGLSGWDRNDVLRGNSFPGDPAQVTGKGHELTQENLDRIEGLRALLGGGAVPRYAGPFMSDNPANNIILGGKGSDLLEGRRR